MQPCSAAPSQCYRGDSLPVLSHWTFLSSLPWPFHQGRHKPDSCHSAEAHILVRIPIPMSWKQMSEPQQENSLGHFTALVLRLIAFCGVCFGALVCLRLGLSLFPRGFKLRPYVDEKVCGRGLVQAIRRTASKAAPNATGQQQQPQQQQQVSALSLIAKGGNWNQVPSQELECYLLFMLAAWKEASNLQDVHASCGL